MLQGFEEEDAAAAAEEKRLSLAWAVVKLNHTDQDGVELLRSLDVPLIDLFEEGSDARALLEYEIARANFDLAQLQVRLTWKCTVYKHVVCCNMCLCVCVCSA